jgi:hypothetical protein
VLSCRTAATGTPAFKRVNARHVLAGGFSCFCAALLRAAPDAADGAAVFALTPAQSQPVALDCDGWRWRVSLLLSGALISERIGPQDAS